MLKKKQPTTTKGQDGIIAPRKKKQRVKPKKTLTKGTMLNIVEITKGKNLEIKKKFLQNCVHYGTKT